MITECLKLTVDIKSILKKKLIITNSTNLNTFRLRTYITLIVERVVDIYFG